MSPLRPPRPRTSRRTAAVTGRTTVATLVTLVTLVALVAPARSGARPQQRPLVRLVEVGRFDKPVGVTFHPATLTEVVIEKTGRLRTFTRQGPGTVALDISSSVSTGNEQGLLGAAFSPDGQFLYIDYTDRGGDTQVVEYQWANGKAVPESRRVVLSVEQPFANHNGGHLAFGPDANLYIALGDGGAGGDPFGNGQNLHTLLGKILRIDPIGRGTQPYGIPGDNPFIGAGGKVRPEIWALGVRNPWKFSFDPGTGDLWIGDVGQDKYEEIDRVPAGAGAANLGWNLREGKHKFKGSKPPNWVDPVYEYSHKQGCSVTGGHLYRGPTLTALSGSYVFGDYCKGTVSALSREGKDGKKWVARELGVKVASLSGFGIGPDAQLYAVSLDGPLYRFEPA